MPKVYLSPAYHYFNACAIAGCDETTHNNLYLDELEPFLDACSIEWKRGPRRTPKSSESAKDLMHQAVAESNEWGADVHYISHTNAHTNTAEDGVGAGTAKGYRPIIYTGSTRGEKLAACMIARRKEIYDGPVTLNRRTDLYELEVPNAASFYEEHVFHDNPAEAKWFHEHLKDVARSAAKGLCDYFDIPFVEPVKEEGKTVKVIDIAQAEIGYLEKVSNSKLDSKTGNAGSGNYTKYARDLDNISGWYNGKKNGYAWCAVFVDWCFVQAYGAAAAKKMTSHTTLGAGCDYAANAYKSAGRWHTTPQVGDEVFFRSGSYSYAHTGLVVGVSASTITTVEGNTSGASGVISNGGGVCRKTYKINSSSIVGYGRPDYSLVNETAPEETPEEEPKEVCNVELSVLRKGSNGNPVKALQLLLIGNGYSCGSAGADGDFGNGTLGAVKKYQQAKSLVADGVVGAKTWKKLLT